MELALYRDKVNIVLKSNAIKKYTVAVLYRNVKELKILQKLVMNLSQHLKCFCVIQLQLFVLYFHS